jgi:hypothetical protein
MTDPIVIDNLGIPPLAGLCSYEDAGRPGIGVDRTVVRLKRYNALLRGLHETACAHLAHTPEWEVKCALGLHLWLDAEHCTLIRERVAEMREPPLGLDAIDDPRLSAALDELLRAEDTTELLTGVYTTVRRLLIAALDDHIAALNPLFDQPTHRMLRWIVAEQRDMLAWGETALAAVGSEDPAAGRAAAFAEHVAAFIAAAGGISGEEDGSAARPPKPRSDGSEYAMDAEPRRDDRFDGTLRYDAPIDEVYADPSKSDDERTWALAAKRLREMDVPEWMAPILFKTRGKPWAYYHELARQLWDETRHAMMGETAFVRLGVPHYQYPITVAAVVALNREFTPLEAHTILWHIEQGLMPRETGKRWEMEIAEGYGDPFFIALQDHDWADEVLHAQIGRRWLRDEYPSAAARQAAGSEIMERWHGVLQRMGAQSPESEWNWWPDFVAQARAARDAA